MIRSIPTEVTNHSRIRTDGVSSSDMLGGNHAQIVRNLVGKRGE